MHSSRSVFLAAVLGAACTSVDGQVVPVSQFQEVAVEAVLNWNDGSPPSIDNEVQSLSSFGQLTALAVANNGGNTTVNSEAEGGTLMINSPSGNPGGFRLAVVSVLSGHSNTAATATSTSDCTAALFFSVLQSMEARLDMGFINQWNGTMGLGGGASTVDLIGPGNVTVFSYTHNPLTTLNTSVNVSLAPGLYSLRTISGAGAQLPFGFQNSTFVTTAVVDLVVPAPGSLAVFGLLAVGARRRRG